MWTRITPTASNITAPNGLKGAKIHLPYPSVGATEQTLLAAVLAEGKTELSGAATEPEIMDLVAVLQKMGAIISVDVDRTFRIEGVKELKGYTHTSLTDRIEAASWGVRRACHSRRHLRQGRHPAGDDDLPQRIPQDRWRIRRPRTRVSVSGIRAAT